VIWRSPAEALNEIGLPSWLIPFTALLYCARNTSCRYTHNNFWRQLSPKRSQVALRSVDQNRALGNIAFAGSD
jgi:hypothetical protein